MDALDEILVEDRLHGLDGRKRILERFEQRHVEHAGLDRRFVGVVLEDIPATDRDILHLGQRHKILDRRTAALGTLPQADGSELGERADGFAGAAFDGLQAGDKGCRHCAHAGDQNP